MTLLTIKTIQQDNFNIFQDNILFTHEYKNNTNNIYCQLIINELFEVVNQTIHNIYNNLSKTISIIIKNIDTNETLLELIDLDISTLQIFVLPININNEIKQVLNIRITY